MTGSMIKSDHPDKHRVEPPGSRHTLFFASCTGAVRLPRQSGSRGALKGMMGELVKRHQATRDLECAAGRAIRFPPIVVVPFVSAFAD